ncbi:MAG: TlpA disulfide reductase family protein [Bacteroidota bacterium]
MNSAEEKAISLFSFKGKYVFLDFWASWCVPCREEHPNIAAQYEKYKHKGFTIVSVSIDTDKDKWLKAITKDKMTWTQVSDLKGEKGETYLKYGITTIPANFLIDPPWYSYSQRPERRFSQRRIGKNIFKKRRLGEY